MCLDVILLYVLDSSERVKLCHISYLICHVIYALFFILHTPDYLNIVRRLIGHMKN